MADVQNPTSNASTPVNSISQYDYTSGYDPVYQSEAAEKGEYGSGDWLTDFLAGLGIPIANDAVNWNMTEQSNENQFLRELYKLGIENQFNADEAQKNRDWQTEMSNTAYQRAIADMKSAGINPLLAFQQGGASSGSGASALSGSGSVGSGSNRAGGSRNDLLKLATTLISVAAGLITKL